jgi:hypothetical protein
LPKGKKEQPEMADEKKAFPSMTTRDPNQPHNELIPKSMRNSGAELDECCSAPGGGIQQAEAGAGFDSAMKKIK